MSIDPIGLKPIPFRRPYNIIRIFDLYDSDPKIVCFWPECFRLFKCPLYYVLPFLNAFFFAPRA